MKERLHWDVLGWEDSSDSVIPMKQTEFLDKGKKDCVQITLEDGRQLVCTPDHPMLTMNRNWVRASQLSVNEHQLKVGVRYPTVNIEKEMEICNRWKMRVGEHLLQTETKQEYFRSLSFMRLLGLLCSEGAFRNGSADTVCFDHPFDASAFKDDIATWSSNENIDVHFQKTVCTGYYYTIKLPEDIRKMHLQLQRVSLGENRNLSLSFPKFALEEGMPQPLLREFVGALFGCDGISCHFEEHEGNENLVTSLSLSRYSPESRLEHLQNYMLYLRKMLKRCGVEKVGLENFRMSEQKVFRIPELEALS